MTNREVGFSMNFKPQSNNFKVDETNQREKKNHETKFIWIKEKKVVYIKVYLMTVIKKRNDKNIRFERGANRMSAKMEQIHFHFNEEKKNKRQKCTKHKRMNK